METRTSGEKKLYAAVYIKEYYKKKLHLCLFSVTDIHMQNLVKRFYTFYLVYFLKDNSGSIKNVCKKFFLKTLGYEEKNDRLLHFLFLNFVWAFFFL